MKWLKAYISFNRTERMGIIALLCILFLLIIVRTTMHLWVKSQSTPAHWQQMATNWNNFEVHTRQKPVADTSPFKQSVVMSTVTVTTAHAPTRVGLFTFDPNTIDSAGLRKLGLREKTTAIFLHWRAKGKWFYKKEDMKGIYTLTPQEYDRIAPFIKIAGGHKAKASGVDVDK